ncbi:MAG: hypothetical protein ACRDI2_04505 [Chloroflexota bacterium]
MAAARAAVARGGKRRGDRSGGVGLPAGRSIPRWVWWAAGALVLCLLVGGMGYLAYGALDKLYPQELWRYYRPLPSVTSGSVLYRNADGHLLLAPLSAPEKVQRITAAGQAGNASGTVGPVEIVRDALVLPDGKAVAYFASEKGSGRAERDYLRVVGLDGRLIRDVALETAGEALRPAMYTSASGRYLALTSLDRERVYYLDVATDAPLTRGEADAPPEEMLWYRDADLRSAPFAGQPAYAPSPDGQQRAQLREGARRAPECGDEPRCETVTELVVSPATAAESAQPSVPLYGAFTAFSAEGWGPVPTQPAERFYGRLVWSPDGGHLLFSTVDGADARVYVVSADGKTRPRLVLQSAEALDWIP